MFGGLLHRKLPVSLSFSGLFAFGILTRKAVYWIKRSNFRMNLISASSTFAENQHQSKKLCYVGEKVINVFV